MEDYKLSCWIVGSLDSYGSSLKVNKWTIRTIFILLGVFIPLLVPIPLMVYLGSKIKKDIIMLRY